MSDLLLGIQITLCALLVTASLVSVRGMVRSLHAPIGFVPRDVVLAEANLNMAGYSDDTALPVQRRMIEQAARIPGVTAVGTVDQPQLSGSGSNSAFYSEGTADLRPTNSVLTAHDYTISPGYLKAAETRLLAGRDFTWDDGPNTPKVALVNERLLPT